MIYDSIIDVIGNTPIVRLNEIADSVPANVFAKLEFMNPGGSIKDRIGWWLIDDAEKRGTLKPGGTVIEGTSGNTGFGLAIAAAIKGYRCVFILPDKMSEEKIRNLRAFGARVVVTPTAVEPDDPRSYYSVSRRLATEIPNSLYIDQYNNLANRECHYMTTGPEILRQMPEIDVLIAGIGTGGTVSGCGRYLKEQKPGVEVVAIDPIGSIVYETWKTGESTMPAEGYLIEGIGEDFIPANYDFNLIDDMVQVSDRESFLITRELLTREGIFSGVSSGSALVGGLRWIREQGERMKGKNVLIVFPDGGSRYLSKVYDDDWMREAGFLESTAGSAADLLKYLHKQPDELILARQSDKVSAVIDQMSQGGISQIPVMDDSGWIKGVVRESAILKALFNKQVSADESVDSLVDTSIEFVTPDESIERISRVVTGGKVPLVTDPQDNDKLLAIITDIDLLDYMGHKH